MELTRHRGWIRAGMIYLAITIGVVAAWILLAPKGFYDTFPGGGSHWVSVLPPYNEHLERDFGATGLGLAVLAALAAIWMAMLRVEGLPWSAAAAVALTPPLLASYLTASQPLFGPRIVRDEALLIAVTLGLSVAVAPGILEGWRSATTLNIQGKDVAGQTMPLWPLMLTAGSVGLGGLVALWRRG